MVGDDRSDDERPLFVDSNLGTHFAVAVSPLITAGELKEKLVSEHSSCFPHLGEIKVLSLTVKRRSEYYHLPDKMSIMHAYEGLLGSWFLFMDASCLLEKSVQQAITAKKRLLPPGLPFENHCMLVASNILAVSTVYPSQDVKGGTRNSIYKPSEEIKKLSNVSDATDLPNLENEAANRSMKGRTYSVGAQHQWKEPPADKRNMVVENVECYRATNKIKNDKQLESKRERKHLSTSATPNISLSENLSVTGIISSYFSEFDEVTSSSKQLQNFLATNNDRNRSQTRSPELITDALCSCNMEILNSQHSGNKFAESTTEIVELEQNDAFCNSEKLSVARRRNFITFRCSDFRRSTSKYRKLVASPNSNVAGKAMGRRLIRAAKSFRNTAKKSPVSIVLSRCSRPNSASVIKAFAFESSDSGG